jgi:hypothetical protein
MVAGSLGLLPFDFSFTAWRDPTLKRRSTARRLSRWFLGAAVTQADLPPRACRPLLPFTDSIKLSFVNDCFHRL